jgi:hypothetical protein
MPIASSSVLNQIRNTPYTQTRVPYFPEGYNFGSMLIEASYYNTVSGYGLLSTNSFSTSYIYGDFTGKDSNGLYAGWETSTTLDDYDSEFLFHGFYRNRFFHGNLDPKILFKFQLGANSSTKTIFYLGLTSDNMTNIENDILGTQLRSGFGLLVQSDGNFQITSNNGSETSYISSDIDTIDTDIHDLYLESDSANSRWGYSWDKGNVNYISTQNPASNTSLVPCGIIKNKEAGTSRRWTIRNCEAVQKRFV